MGRCCFGANHIQLGEKEETQENSAGEPSKTVIEEVGDDDDDDDDDNAEKGKSSRIRLFNRFILARVIFIRGFWF